MVVGIAKGVNVSHATVDCLKFFNDIDKLRAVEISRPARLNIGISGGLDKKGHIADFEV
jgi:hypothetical protein